MPSWRLGGLPSNSTVSPSVPAVPMLSNRRCFLVHAAALVPAWGGLTTVALTQAHAQSVWPARSVRIVVPAAADSTADILARGLAAELQRLLGKPFVVDNRSAADGSPGVAQVAKAPPDGYTLLMGTVDTQAISPSLHSTLPYDAAHDFVAIALVATVPNVLVMNPGKAQQHSIRRVKDLVRVLKANPGKFTMASPGHGTSLHLAGELFKRMTGSYMVHLPYPGIEPALADLMAGNVDLMFDHLPSAMPHIRSGRLTALAVTSAARSGAAPELPTVAETGGPLLKGFEASAWLGLLAPAGAGADVVGRCQQATLAALATPALKERLLSQGAIPGSGTPAQFAVFLQAEMRKWARVVKASNTKLD